MTSVTLSGGFAGVRCLSVGVRVRKAEYAPGRKVSQWQPKALHLLTRLKAAPVKTQGSAYSAETENISANGVLLAMDTDVAVGSMVDFTILLPAGVVGARQDVQIDCRGRVVRTFEDRGRRAVGVVIDEYHFERA